jgi:hypothetical protein
MPINKLKEYFIICTVKNPTVSFCGNLYSVVESAIQYLENERHVYYDDVFEIMSTKNNPSIYLIPVKIILKDKVKKNTFKFYKSLNDAPQRIMIDDLPCIEIDRPG